MASTLTNVSLTTRRVRPVAKTVSETTGDVIFPNSVAAATYLVDLVDAGLADVGHKTLLMVRDITKTVWITAYEVIAK